MRKKGGMELSINAIVILIIAMVVLGIGILFIRGLFAKSAEKLTTAISSQEIQNPATPDQPLVADREVLISRTNPTKTVVASVFNNEKVTAKNVQLYITHCITSGDTPLSQIGPLGMPIIDGDTARYRLRTVKQDVAPNTYVGYQGVVTFSPKANLKQGDIIICTIKAVNFDSSNPIWFLSPEKTGGPSTTIKFTVTS